MRDFLYFANKSSADFGMYITDGGGYDSAARIYESVSIPGRNGNLLFEKDSYENTEISYPAVIVDDFDTNFKALAAFLYSQKGYQRLMDTFHPEEFYLATFKGIEGLKHTVYAKAGTFRVVFERKPQKFLVSGERKHTFSTGGKIKNPTLFNAKPLISVGTNSYVAINDTTMTVGTLSGVSTVDIDCDMQEAYSGSVNCNGIITLNNGEFPVLKPGVNSVAGFAKTSSSTGVLVTFSDQCETESISYDYLQLYYQNGSTWYGTAKLGGTGASNTLAGASIYIPSHTFRLYWRTDSSVNKWGFKIDSITPASSGEDVFSAATPPSIEWETVIGTTNLPETAHPYDNSDSKGYEITAGLTDKSITITPRWWTI